MERWNLINNMHKDMYEIVTEYSTNCYIKPPPQYKETSLSGRKKRFRSQGELTPGDYRSPGKTPVKRNRSTTGGAKTKMKYYNSNELKYYGHISKKDTLISGNTGLLVRKYATTILKRYEKNINMT